MAAVECRLCGYGDHFMVDCAAVNTKETGHFVNMLCYYAIRGGYYPDDNWLLYFEGSRGVEDRSWIACFVESGREGDGWLEWRNEIVCEHPLNYYWEQQLDRLNPYESEYNQIHNALQRFYAMNAKYRKSLVNTKKKMMDLGICAICQETMKPEESRCVLKCKHVFCTSCIFNWYSMGKNTCPTCRDIDKKINR